MMRLCAILMLLIACAAPSAGEPPILRQPTPDYQPPWPIFITTQFTNAEALASPRHDLHAMQFVWETYVTADGNDKHSAFDPVRARRVLTERLKPGVPVVMNIEHRGEETPQGRRTLRQIAALTREVLGHGTRIGFFRLMPKNDPFVALRDDPERRQAVVEQDRLMRAEVAPGVDYVCFWATPFTEDWDHWSQVVEDAVERGRTFHKPVYAWISPTFHPSPRQGEEAIANQPVSPERLAWMIERLRELGADGAVLGQTHSAGDPPFVIEVDDEIHRVLKDAALDRPFGQDGRWGQR